MNKNKQLRLEQSELDITVALDKKTVEGVMSKTLDNFRKNMTIRGFRKGMAPIERVRAAVKPGDLLGQSMTTLLDSAVKIAAAEVKPEDNVVDGPTYKLNKYDLHTFEVVFTYPVKPTFTMKDFRELQLTFKQPEFNLPEMVANEIKAFEQRVAKWQVVEGEAKLGDKVKVDLKSDIIKYNVEEQQFEDYEIIIGKGVLLKEFEEQIIGLKVGESRQIKILLPMTHTIEVIRGKEVIYDLKLKSIERFIVPKLTDEFVQSAKIKDVNTVDQFIDYVTDLIEKRELTNAKNRFVQEVINQLKLDAKMVVSQIAVSNEASRNVQSTKKRMEQQKQNFAKWLQDNKMDENRLFEIYKMQAQTRMIEGLILAAIAERENIKNTEAEYNSKLEEISKEQRVPLEIAKKIYPKETIESLISNQKVIDMITNHFIK